MFIIPFLFFFFFFNDTATTEIYTLSLHDALPIWKGQDAVSALLVATGEKPRPRETSGIRPARALPRDRKSTRLNSSHSQISYAVFCLKKKKKKQTMHFYEIAHIGNTSYEHLRMRT